MNIHSIGSTSSGSQALYLQTRSSATAQAPKKTAEAAAEDFQALLQGSMGASSGDACVSQYTKLGNFQATGGSNAPSIQSGQRPPPPPPFGLGGNSSTGNNGIPEELQSYDTNQDGKIAGDEFSLIQADIQSGKLQPPPAFGPDGMGHGKPPGLPKEIESYDTNSDSQIGLDEIEALIKDLKSGKLQLPEPPPLQVSTSQQLSSFQLPSGFWNNETEDSKS